LDKVIRKEFFGLTLKGSTSHSPAKSLPIFNQIHIMLGLHEGLMPIGKGNRWIFVALCALCDPEKILNQI
jgi:hypothetical protein